MTSYQHVDFDVILSAILDELVLWQEFIDLISAVAYLSAPFH